MRLMEKNPYSELDSEPLTVACFGFPRFPQISPRSPHVMVYLWRRDTYPCSHIIGLQTVARDL